MESIVMPRGDIRPVAFTVAYPDGTHPSPALDEIYFTVKEDFNDISYVFQKKLSTGEIEPGANEGEYQFVIEAEDTDPLEINRTYAFDIEVLRGNDIKQTFTGELTLTSEATHAVNEV